ncbi:response regulator [Paenibacillus sp. HB172176]|uniref:response regulator n=1 Tax=Paenibacillus sp. HB172176 TaxID=2493690 RepID=UPI0014386F89|nr:response regulator [Paenibacillus sp. HB172176]
MNLMIVEDEPRLRNNLALDIPWEEHGIQVIGLAASGEEVVALFDRKKPDIILADIQMPGMNGLELAEWVNARDPLVKMILLSGHDSFDYARKAVELGISKYLLKPAGDTEIVNAVLQAAGDLKKHLDQLHNVSLFQEKWKQHLPNLREMFLLNWLHGKYSPWEIQWRSRDVQFPIDSIGHYCVALLDMDPLAADESRFTERDTSLLHSSLFYITQETLQQGSVWVAPDRDGATAVLFATEGSPDTEGFLHQVNASIGKLLGIVRECLKITASAGISGVAAKPRELNQLYEQAREALQRRIVYGNNIAVTYQDRFETETRHHSYPDIERELEVGLDTGNAEKCGSSLQKLWTFMLGEARTVDEVNEALFYFSSLFIRLIQQRGGSVKEVAGPYLLYLQNLQSFSTKEQVYEFLTNILERLQHYLAEKRGAAGHKMVDAVLQMIEEGLHEELSLHAVADRLFINSSYLSRLFKQETGKAFSSYVLERKMERAKSALQEGAKVYDAASGVGFRDVSYFTKVFRKFWGITPREMARN